MCARAGSVLVMIAHPDDADVHGGGAVARWVDEGREVHDVLFTSGDKGHHDPTMTRDEVIALRRAEQRAAAATLGVQRVTFLEYEGKGPPCRREESTDVGHPEGRQSQAPISACCG